MSKDRENHDPKEITLRYNERISEIETAFRVPVTDSEQLERLKELGFETEKATCIPLPQTAKEALNQAENLYGEKHFEFLKMYFLNRVIEPSIKDLSKKVESIDYSLNLRPDERDIHRSHGRSTTDFAILNWRYKTRYYRKYQVLSSEIGSLGEVIGHIKFSEWLKEQIKAKTETDNNRISQEEGHQTTEETTQPVPEAKAPDDLKRLLLKGTDDEKEAFCQWVKGQYSGAKGKELAFLIYGLHHLGLFIFKDFAKAQRAIEATTGVEVGRQRTVTTYLDIKRKTGLDLRDKYEPDAKPHIEAIRKAAIEAKLLPQSSEK